MLRFILVFCVMAMVQSVQAGEYDWTVTREWTAADEDKFSEFIAIMGDSQCTTLNKCLTSATANPFYVNKTPKSSQKPYLADCADLPYALRMYFAWMEGLSFDYVSAVSPAEPSKETSKDIRYTRYGNKPGQKKQFTVGQKYNAYSEMINLINTVSTATYRMHYDFVGDFYPTELNLINIRPGTVLYDPAGHAAIIYKIESDGRIKMMDAHPDQSITRITFDKRFSRSRVAHGAGFRNWRPELNTAATASLSGFSTEQFNQSYELQGQVVDYYDYVRTQMAGGHLQFNPVTELKNSMLEICENIKDRVRAVGLSIEDQIDRKAHPDRLPENIYGTSGEWEEYSTPSRDARLKVSFVSLYQDALRLIQSYENGDPSVVYEVKSSPYSTHCAANDTTCYLVASMIEAYEQTNQDVRCQFQYINSGNRSVQFDYHDIATRLFALSFDPYHCVELRWGAQGEELKTCASDGYKLQWYTAEQGLRNQIERTYEAKMNFDVHGVVDLGVKTPPVVDLLGELTQINQN